MRSSCAGCRTGRARRHHGAGAVPDPADIAGSDRHAGAARARDDERADRLGGRLAGDRGRCRGGRHRGRGVIPVAAVPDRRRPGRSPRSASLTCAPCDRRGGDRPTTLLSVAIPASRLASARSGVDGTVEYAGAERRSRLAASIGRLPLPTVGRCRRPARPGAGPRTQRHTGALHVDRSHHRRDRHGGIARLLGEHAALRRGPVPCRAGAYQFAAGQPFQGSRFQEESIPVLGRPASRTWVGNFQESLDAEPGRHIARVAWALNTVKGAPVTPTMLEGRWPGRRGRAGRGDAALLGLLATRSPRRRRPPERLTIVGVPVFPDFGFGAGLGQGAGMTMDGLRPSTRRSPRTSRVGIAPGADQGGRDAPERGS